MPCCLNEATMNYRLIIVSFLILLGASACEDSHLNEAVASGTAALTGTAATSAGAETTAEGKPPAAAGEGRISPKDFDLEASAALVRDGKVKDGAALQKELNRPARSKIDLDRDGKRDPIQVVERREDGKRALEIRAIPSSKRKSKPDEVAVPVAVLEFEPDGSQVKVIARYVDGIIVAAPPPIIIVMPVVVGTLCHWVLIIERPIFIGTVVVVHHYHKHRKHKKHKKW